MHRILLAFILVLHLPAQILFPILAGRHSGTPPPSGMPFVTSFTPGMLRNDSTVEVGMRFLYYGTYTPALYLGRNCYTGNTGSMTLRLRYISDTTVAGTATVNMTGCTPGNVVYGAYSGDALANTYYFLSSEETNGGNDWSETAPAVIDPTMGGELQSAYFSGGVITASTPLQSYVGLQMLVMP